MEFAMLQNKHQPRGKSTKIEMVQPLDFNFNSFVADLRVIAGRQEGVERDRTDYLISEMISKYPFGDSANSPAVRQEIAIQKLMTANATCKVINEQGYRTDRMSTEDLNKILRRARYHIGVWLPPFSYEMYEHCKFTSGSSTSRSYEFRDPWYKYSTSEPLHVSSRALSRFLSIVNNTPMWVANGGENGCKIYNHDKVMCVPKNALEDRAIIPQQDGNSYLQKGQAWYINRGLRRAGCDLRSQGRNQQLARRASISRSESTLDLKNASALMSYRVVWDLIPQNLFEELDAVRNSHGLLPNGEVIRWEMFSSMGNAFNFELETLIFLALATSACEFLGSYVGDISVYGDDIIVPTSCAHFVCDVLHTVGFEINEKKSHIAGNFRESCGAHWYNGINFNPFYIKREVTTYADAIRLANRLRQWAGVGGIGDPRFYKLWLAIADLVPKYLHGGRCVVSNDALVSPCRPRSRLVRYTECKPINGWRAYCRSMQGIGVSYLFVEDILPMPDDAISSGHLTIANDKYVMVKRNDRYYGHMSPPWFPCEFANVQLAIFEEPLEEPSRASTGRDLSDPNYAALRYPDIIDVEMGILNPINMLTRYLVGRRETARNMAFAIIYASVTVISS